jgi:hypothetical protein
LQQIARLFAGQTIAETTGVSVTQTPVHMYLNDSYLACITAAAQIGLGINMYMMVLFRGNTTSLLGDRHVMHRIV